MPAILLAATFAQLGICVNGRSPLGFPYTKYRCIAPRNALALGYAHPHPTASRFSPFHAAFPSSSSIGRKSHAECFASVNIVTSWPQQRVLIREMYSLSPGNVVLSSRSIYTTEITHESRRLTSRLSARLIRFAACDLNFRLVTTPENVRHACALPLQQWIKETRKREKKHDGWPQDYVARKRETQ